MFSRSKREEPRDYEEESGNLTIVFLAENMNRNHFGCKAFNEIHSTKI